MQTCGVYWSTDEATFNAHILVQEEVAQLLI